MPILKEVPSPSSLTFLNNRDTRKTCFYATLFTIFSVATIAESVHEDSKHPLKTVPFLLAEILNILLKYDTWR